MFKKDLTSKTIVYFIATVFLFNTMAYGIELPINEKLRVPIGLSEQRIEEAKKEFTKSISVMMDINGESVGQNKMKQVTDKPLYADIGPCICLVNGDKMFHINSEVYLQYNDSIMNRIKNNFDLTKTTYIFDNETNDAAKKALIDIPNSILWNKNNKKFRKIVLYPDLKFQVYDEDNYLTAINNPLSRINSGTRSAI